MRIPKHIGIIPDGNRRYALSKGLSKEEGYQFGLEPGLKVLKLCSKLGVKELTYYGFTIDNTKRPVSQRIAFSKACVDAVKMITNEDVSLLVVGNTDSEMFPNELMKYTNRTTFGNGRIRVNFLVNYGYEWDLNNIKNNNINKKSILCNIKSSDISRVDLIIRWGGRTRLSGFLPVQSVYSDFYSIDDYWPNFKPEHIYMALKWYEHQDTTLGG